VACLRMALDHWRYEVPPALALAAECVDAGAYVRRGDRVDGLIYAPFAAYVRRRWGLVAESRPELTAAEVRGHIAAGGLAMLSVHPSIRGLGPEPPQRGGHLVLAVGFPREFAGVRAGPLDRPRTLPRGPRRPALPAPARRCGAACARRGMTPRRTGPAEARKPAHAESPCGTIGCVRTWSQPSGVGVPDAGRDQGAG
jgi:hypothetical protein